MEASSDRVSYSGLGAKETIPEPAPASCSGCALLHTAAVFARVPSRFPVISTLLDMDVYLPPSWCVPARHAADYPAPWLFLPSSCKPFGNEAANGTGSVCGSVQHWSDWYCMDQWASEFLSKGEGAFTSRLSATTLWLSRKLIGHAPSLHTSIHHFLIRKYSDTYFWKWISANYINVCSFHSTDLNLMTFNFMGLHIGFVN